MFLDDRRRRRGDRRNEQIEQYTSDVPSSSSLSSSSSMYGSDNDQAIFEYEHIASRQLLFDEVTKLSGSLCSLTTSLRTEYKGYQTASGIMFTIQPSKELKDVIELLTLEFPTFENYGSSSDDPSAARKVQVYYLKGSFIDLNVINKPNAWTLIADTSARLISSLLPSDALNPAGADMGAIIPKNEFLERVFLEAGQIYSIYIAGQVSSPNPNETLLKVKPANGLIGEISTENELLQVHTGVRLKGSSFPSAFVEPADFNGILHYRATKSCSDSTMFTTTDIVLEFAVNDDPTGVVMGNLRTAVIETLSGWLSMNGNLMRYSEEDMLKLEGIVVNFTGRSEEKCPIDFANCALAAATVSFKHLPNLDQGLLQMEIFGQSKQMDQSVHSYMSPVDLAYVSNPLSKVEFAITLTGVPIGEEMNKIQKRYFEKVTVNFLRKYMTSKVFNAIVNDEISETPFIEDGEPPTSRTRMRKLLSFLDFAIPARERMPMLRRSRKLQGTTVSGGKIQIITEIAGEGSVQELRSTVLEWIGNQPVEFTKELISQQMRPAEITEKDGNFFSDLTNIQVKPYESTNGSSNPVGGNGIAPPVQAGRERLWVIVCIFLIVFSVLWLCYRIYMDCFHSPFQKPIKLNNDKDEFKDECESELSNFFKNSSALFERLTRPSGFQDVSNSDVAPKQYDKSDSSFKPDGNNKNQSSLTRPRFLERTALMKQKDGLKPVGRKMSFNSYDDKPKSISNTVPPRISPSRSRERSRNSEAHWIDKDQESCSSADIESSDEESIQKSTPPRTQSDQRRGRLTATKSMPVQKRNQTGTGSSIKKQMKAATKPAQIEKGQISAPQRSLSGPRRGRLTPSKSLPVQKRNQAQQSIELKKQLKASMNPAHNEKPSRSSTPHQPLNWPRRGRLTATNSMPVQKRNQAEPGTGFNRYSKISMKPAQNESPHRSSTPNRSRSGPMRGRLTATKSMPMQKRNQGEEINGIKKQKKTAMKPAQIEKPQISAPNRSTRGPRRGRLIPTKSLPMQKRDVKRTNSMPVANKKNHHSRKSTSSGSPSSSMEDAKKTNFQKENSKGSKVVTSKKSKKIDRLSSHSGSEKKETVEKKRGVKASKSLPIQKKKTKPELESSIKKLVDMVHDSDSDSTDSDRPSKVSTTTNSASTNTPRKSPARKSGASRKSNGGKKYYGKAGKIQFGVTKEEKGS